jgi:hypothetical protein
MKVTLRRIHAAVRDAAYGFRMPGGIPGDVNRTHPASIEPTRQSATPATAYGQPVVVAADGTNGVRPLSVGDGALTNIYGITVRPYPAQASTGGSYGSATLGAATPPGAASIIDVLKLGYICANVPVGSAAAAKGGAVFVWVAATSGLNVQGGFQTAASGGNTIALDTSRYTFNGPQDANGNIEVVIRA